MINKLKIVPALLTDNCDTLVSMIAQAKSFVDWVQIDLMDGRFVPSHSVTPEELEALQPEINWEAHLMAEKPERILSHIKNAGARRVIFHYEATSNHEYVIDKARDLQLEIGIALNPSTPAAALRNLASSIDCVLFMTVNPGFYGARFIPEVLDKVQSFRREYSSIDIGIDGGIKKDNIRKISATGADSACVGSAIFLSSNPADSYHNLLKIANS